MATQFYLESADRPSQSGLANESLAPGVLVSDDGTGVAKFAFADGDYDGLALYDPEWLSAEDEDAIASGTYEVDDRVRFHPSEDAAVVKARTIDDDTAPAPNIGHRSVVGVVDDSSVDAPAAPQGRLVEEGYTTDIDGDGVTTEFSRANNNFIAVGRAYRPGRTAGSNVTDFDAPVRTVLFGEGQA